MDFIPVLVPKQTFAIISDRARNGIAVLGRNAAHFVFGYEFAADVVRQSALRSWR
jgi:hypothetical protein